MSNSRCRSSAAERKVASGRSEVHLRDVSIQYRELHYQETSYQNNQKTAKSVSKAEKEVTKMLRSMSMEGAPKKKTSEIKPKAVCGRKK